MCERGLRLDSPRSYLAGGLSKKAFAGPSPPTHDNNLLCISSTYTLGGSLSNVALINPSTQAINQMIYFEYQVFGYELPQSLKHRWSVDKTCEF